mgnify:CR=1 FL=1
MPDGPCAVLSELPSLTELDVQCSAPPALLRAVAPLAPTLRSLALGEVIVSGVFVLPHAPLCCRAS